MRDPARIDRLLAAVRRVWIQHPDSRLGQLIVNAARMRDPDAVDVFNVEDEHLERLLATLEERLRVDAYRPSAPPAAPPE
jgi:hypothetical protein